MVIYDDTLYWFNQNAWESSCRIRIIELESPNKISFLKNYYIVASDLGNDTDTSITDEAEILISLVCSQHNIAIEKMIWFEHYPHTGNESVATINVATPQTKISLPSVCSRFSVKQRPATENEINHLNEFIEL